MQIVINIPDNMKVMCEWHTEGICDLAIPEINILAKAISNGTVLSKGHGRLIDADKIIYYRCPDNVLDCPQSYDFTCQHCDFGIATKFRTDRIPTIIEADKEV